MSTLFFFFRNSPGCEHFILTNLWPAFADLGSEVMNLTVIPFGNAKIDKDAETVECQHGRGECDANTYELCAIEMTNHHVEDYLPFLVCNAKTLPSGFHAGPFDPKVFESCAHIAGLWWEALHVCHETPSLAWQVNLKASKASPDHPYVPYVLLNGSELAEGVDFKSEICRLYKEQGGSHPKCSEVTLLNPFTTAAVCPDVNVGVYPLGM